jgi:membrane protein DedA with SNARE-associated domain
VLGARSGDPVSVLKFITGNLDYLLMTYGYLAVFILVGTESIGIPVPGETMLITAAIYAGRTHRLSIVLVIVAAAAGAIVGDNIGYTIGRLGGYPLLRRYGRYIRLDQRRLKLGQYLFRVHGSKVVFFGRFVAYLRTFAAFLSGANLMHWRRFLLFNALGGITWSLLFGVGGYLLGTQIERLSRPVGIVLLIAGIVGLVGFFVFLRRNEERLLAEAERAIPGDR